MGWKYRVVLHTGFTPSYFSTRVARMRMATVVLAFITIIIAALAYPNVGLHMPDETMPMYFQYIIVPHPMFRPIINAEDIVTTYEQLYSAYIDWQLNAARCALEFFVILLVIGFIISAATIKEANCSRYLNRWIYMGVIGGCLLLSLLIGISIATSLTCSLPLDDRNPDECGLIRKIRDAHRCYDWSWETYFVYITERIVMTRNWEDFSNLFPYPWMWILSHSSLFLTLGNIILVILTALYFKADCPICVEKVECPDTPRVPSIYPSSIRTAATSRRTPHRSRPGTPQPYSFSEYDSDPENRYDDFGSKLTAYF